MPRELSRYEPTLIDGTFVQGSLTRSEVESEPDESADAIGDLLDDAERIVEEAEPDVLRELDRDGGRRKWWQRKKRGGSDDGGDWHLSNR